MVTKDEIFVFGGYRLDVRERRLWRGSAIVSLSPKTFDLLVVMLQGAGRLLEKDYLIRSVWPDSFVQDANLSVHIATIRRILGKTADVEQFIETVPKVGYRFVVPVSCPPELEASAAEIRAENAPDPDRKQLPWNLRNQSPAAISSTRAQFIPRMEPTLHFAATAREPTKSGYVEAMAANRGGSPISMGQ